MDLLKAIEILERIKRFRLSFFLLAAIIVKYEFKTKMQSGVYDMRESSKNTAGPNNQDKLTVNIFAMFVSVVVFLFIQQAGILLLNVLFSLNYPKDVSNIGGFFSALSYILVLTAIFGFAAQAGYEIIRRVKAEEKIYIVYNTITLLILIVQGLTVFTMISPMYIVPNIFICSATLYGLYKIKMGISVKKPNKSKKRVG